MISDQFIEERKQVAEMMTRLYNTRLTTTSGGNISLKINEDTFCITPSSLDKASLTPELIAVVKMDGENLTPHLKLSIESEMHRLILLENPDINAVVHAHPVFSTLYSCAEKEVDTSIIAESWFLLGRPLTAKYHKMGTPELAREVADCAKKARIVLLENHGVLATGSSLLNAFDGIEVFENAAKLTYYSTILKSAGEVIHSLTPEEMKELRPDL